MYLKKTLQKRWNQAKKNLKNKNNQTNKIESRKAFYLCPIIV